MFGPIERMTMHRIARGMGTTLTSAREVDIWQETRGPRLVARGHPVDAPGPLHPAGLSAIQVVFISVYWSWAWTDLSWPPKPDCLYPPNGVVMSPSA